MDIFKAPKELLILLFTSLSNTNWSDKFSYMLPIKSGKKDQLISIYFLGPFSSFPNITARTITKADETAKRNINILSSPNVYHSMIMPSYDSL